MKEMPTEPVEKPHSRVVVRTTTWTRDSHDLFDYEARHVVNKQLSVQESSRLCRNDSEIHCIPESGPIPNQAEPLMKVQIGERDGKCLVTPPDRMPNTQTKNRHLWLIVKELKMPGHRLAEGDIIKLGRFRLRIRQICNTGQTSLPELDNDGDAELSIRLSEQGMTEERLAQTPCRICLQDGQVEEDDPLIAPCHCKGSIGWVHLQCLRRWIDGRRNKDQGATPYSFYYAPLQCELCKKNYPIALKVDEKKYSLLRVPEIEPPFIVLENTSVNRGLHILSMSEKKSLKLGRGHESDVRISDVSISRTHATIKYSDDFFILEDHGSKFGTLVSLRKQQALDDWKGSLALQVGRTTVEVAYEEASTSASGSTAGQAVDSNEVNFLGGPGACQQGTGASDNSSANPGSTHDASATNNSQAAGPVGCQMLNMQQHWQYAPFNFPRGTALSGIIPVPLAPNTHIQHQPGGEIPHPQGDLLPSGMPGFQQHPQGPPVTSVGGPITTGRGNPLGGSPVPPGGANNPSW